MYIEISICYIGHPIHFQKIKSHIGILGNEAADVGAKLALTAPLTDFAYDFHAFGSGYLASLPAWPCSSLPNTSRLSFLSNLTTDISSHLLDACPTLTDGSKPTWGTKGYDTYQTLTTSLLPLPSNHMWPHPWKAPWGKALPLLSHPQYP